MLTQAAVSGAQDWLLGLKENVIIGRLIPARVDIPGMAELLKPQPIPDMAAVSPPGWLGVTEAPISPFDGDSGQEPPVDTSIFGPAVGNGETPDNGDGPPAPLGLAPEAAAAENADSDDEEDDEDFFDDDEDEEDVDAEEVVNDLSHNDGNGANGAPEEDVVEVEEDVAPDSDEGDE